VDELSKRGGASALISRFAALRNWAISDSLVVPPRTNHISVLEPKTGVSFCSASTELSLRVTDFAPLSLRYPGSVFTRVQWYDESRAYKLSFKQQMSPAGYDPAFPIPVS